MKKSILFLSGSFAVISTAFAQTGDVFFGDDLQTTGKEQKEMKTQKAVFASEKRADKAAVRNLQNSDASFFTKEAFYRDFGNVPVSGYEHEASYDVVCFTGDNGPMKAFYDDGPQLIGTLSEKQFTDLPQAAQTCLNAKYAGYEKGRIILFDDDETNANDMLFFGQTIEADNYFVVLTKDGQSQIMRVTMNGDVSFFSKL